MSQTNRRRRRRRLPKWALPALVGGGLILAGLLWLAPRRVDDVVTVEGDARWSREQAPPRREIIWRPAESVPAPLPDEDDIAGEGPVELANPQWADGGLSLYYTVRRDGVSADIYRSLWQGDRWSPGEPVDALNTTADDYGPRISADGKRLLLYSNRPGGVGGFDLYVSRKTDDGWSQPINLGDGVNTPANEYAPAISPDGAKLYFASNRTKRMQAHASDKKSNAEWSATLRAEAGLRQYDLYVAQRGEDRQWAAPAPLPSVNSATSNEGEPLVSPDGAFLYFTSDRANGHGEVANYDVYRARLIGDTLGRTENLGPGVNTAGDEHEPALSDEGFRLIYSSNHPRAAAEELADVSATVPPTFALYESRAVEVFDETAWDTSHATGLLAHWWLLLLALLLAALAAAIVWYIRQVSLKRASVPGFLLLALMLHLFLAGISFLLHEHHVIYALSHDSDNVVADASLRETTSRRDEPRFDEVADLASVATAKPQAAPRQAAPRTSAALPQLPPAPNKPAPLRPEQPAPRVATFTPPAPPTTDPEFSRRRMTVEELAAAEPIKMLEAEPAGAPAEPNESAPSTTNVNVARQSTPATDALASAAASRPNKISNAPTPFDISSARPQGMSVPTSAAITSQSPLVREQGMAAEVEALAKIELDNTAGGAPSATPSVNDFVTPPGKVHIAREAAPPSDSALAAAGAARPHTAAGQKSLSPTELAGAPNLAEATDAPSSAGNVTLNRTSFSLAKIDNLGGKIQLEDAGGPPTETSTSEDGAPFGAIVNVDRQSSSEAGSASSIEAVAQFNSRGKSSPNANSLARADTDQSAPDTSNGSLAEIFGRRASQTQSGAEFGDVQLADANATGDAPTSSDSANDDLTGVAINAQRQASPGDAVAVALESFEGPTNPGPAGIAPGELAAVNFDLRPSSGPLDSPFSRRTAPNMLLKFAEGRIGLQSMLRLRVGDDAMKKDLIDAFGGDDDATLAAIRRGLAFLVKAQMPQGQWDFRKFRHTGNRKQGSTNSLTAATGFGLLPFLGDGHTHLEGPYQKTVDGGLKWLVEHQKENGDLFTGGEGNAHMYSHAIAAIALCEAYGLSRDEALKEPAQAAIDFIADAQHNDGGWRYQPNQSGDTSVFGWQIMALKSAQMAGLQVPDKTLENAKRYLQKAGVKNRPGEFGYQPGGGGKPAMTAEGLLCLEYLGAKKSDPNLQAGVQYLMSRPPANGQDDSYYWYYGTQTLFHYQGEAWTAWNEGLNPTLLATQQTQGDMAGAWPKRDNWEQQAGPLYATSLRLLMLEVYVRHVPLYQIED